MGGYDGSPIASTIQIHPFFKKKPYRYWYGFFSFLRDTLFLLGSQSFFPFAACEVFSIVQYLPIDHLKIGLVAYIINGFALWLFAFLPDAFHFTITQNPIARSE